MKRILILFSGGADSVLLADWALNLPETAVSLLLIDYGQRHVEELMYASRLIKRLPRLIDNVFRLDITDTFKYHHSNLLQGKRQTYLGVHIEHVPGRNGVFLTIALGIAESHGIDEIWIGCDYSDRMNLFPDCSQEWIKKIDELAQINGSRPIRIRAPLLGLKKETITLMLKEKGYNAQEIFSGYIPPKKR